MRERLHSLDGLRAVAACLVVAHHLGVASAAEALTKAGHLVIGRLLSGLTASGVELFFVLSPIVLASPYIRGERPFILRKYAVRRVERLMPPYLAAWLLAGLQIYLVTAFPTWWTIGADLPQFSVLGWLAQIAIIYVGTGAYSFAWWSLVVEVAFYIVLPVLIPLFRHIKQWRNGLAVSYITSIIVACVIYAMPVAGGIPILSKGAAYVSCFCAGLVIATLGPFSRSLRIVIGTVGAAWLLASAWSEQLDPHVGWGMVHLWLVSAAMTHGTWISRVLSRYNAVWLGERSYSLYLTHFTVIGLVCHAFSEVMVQKGIVYFLLTRVTSVLASLAAMILVFHFIERRFAHGLVTADAIVPWRRRATDFVQSAAPETGR